MTSNTDGVVAIFACLASIALLACGVLWLVILPVVGLLYWFGALV